MYQQDDIKEIVLGFERAHNATERYASFDYAYNYFNPSSDRDLTNDMEKSCLALGFYLASWGMFRGSSFILKKSSKNFVPLIEYISEQPKDVWSIDANTYSAENIDILIEQYNKIKESLVPVGTAHLTLVTKIMLGVFGSTPAFDRFFISSFRAIFKDECGFAVFNKKSLTCLSKFYSSNELVIDDMATSSKTISFETGISTNLSYTRAKVIDMYGFTKGLNKAE
jgi:hypothetical protein